MTGVGPPAPPGPPGAPAQAWEPRAYPQALRGPWHRWWRPLLGIAVVLGAGLIAVIGLTLVLAVYALLSLSGAVGTPAFVEDAWFVTPWGLLSTNLALAMGIPVAGLAVWAGQRWRPGFVSSVAGRLRWPLLLASTTRAALVLVPMLLAAIVVDAATSGAFGDLLAFAPEPQWLALALVVLLTTPLQAAGEEYFFRGWLTQAIGSWCASARLALVLPALVSATLFALAHGAQDPWLFADRFVFGLLASLLVWRTGGLEGAIAVHTVNNVVVFAVAIAYGDLEASLGVTSASPWIVLLDVVAFAAAALVVVRHADRAGVAREVPGGWVGRRPPAPRTFPGTGLPGPDPTGSEAR
ncbi:CPBP family intramembrane glutamic endopeptidase [Cellulomonas timonensis]|uniref:CPBP family intramembrane glutamic endopeptidase n=1 Tax=Cellulomonas timonensis TaxID=1689271 RepID=UPI00082D2B05|nr:type II CAAX endopeptidase family protein [Cellulomonas timonensis]